MHAPQNGHLQPTPPPVAAFQQPPVVAGRPLAQQPATPPAAPAVPRLTMGSEPVVLREQTSSGTGLHKTIAYVIAAVAGLAITAQTLGIFLLALLVAPIVDMFRWKKVRARLAGSGIRVSEHQLPFIHECVKSFADRLGMKKLPEVYIVEDSVQNGVAFKLGKKDVLLLTDDIVWGTLQSKDPRSLAFVIGHELAHIALGHTKTLRTMLTTAYKPLSRCDELTADNVARTLVGDAEIAMHGLTVLTVGPQLLRYIDDGALRRQVEEVAQNARLSKKAEAGSTHPLLLRRMANVLAR